MHCGVAVVHAGSCDAFTLVWEHQRLQLNEIRGRVGLGAAIGRPVRSSR